MRRQCQCPCALAPGLLVTVTNGGTAGGNHHAALPLCLCILFRRCQTSAILEWAVGK
uniref:Uncharacterized protein n=1 Tax=Brassica campestris TaxID=3711 RepID=A0A3P5Z0E9_BRACM|nr:unnamed protein product [Brassica rapa]